MDSEQGLNRRLRKNRRKRARLKKSRRQSRATNRVMVRVRAKARQSRTYDVMNYIVIISFNKIVLHFLLLQRRTAAVLLVVVGHPVCSGSLLEGEISTSRAKLLEIDIEQLD